MAEAKKERKFAKYVNEFSRPDEYVPHESHFGNISHPPMLFDANNVPEARIHVEAFIIYAPGDGFGVGNATGGFAKLMPGAKPYPVPWDKPMRHAWPETFLYYGTDPKDVTNLGGEIEYWLGEGDEAEQYIINKSTAVYVPAGVIHCPIYVRKVTRPFMMVVVLESPNWYGEFVEIPKAFKASVPHPKGYIMPGQPGWVDKEGA
jgi:hypothetical protein